MLDSQNQVVELARYVANHSTIDAFADEVKCTPSALRNIIAGRRKPSINLAARIIAATKGRVKLTAFTREAAE